MYPAVEAGGHTVSQNGHIRRSGRRGSPDRTPITRDARTRTVNAGNQTASGGSTDDGSGNLSSDPGGLAPVALSLWNRTVTSAGSETGWIGLVVLLGGGLACLFFPRQILSWWARRGDRNAAEPGQAGILRGCGVLLVTLGVGVVLLTSS